MGSSGSALAVAPLAERGSVRGKYMQTFATQIGRLPAADRDVIRAQIPEETWQAIDASGLLGWLPVSINHACTLAIATRLGRPRAHEFFRALLLEAVESPLLRGLVQSVLRVAVKDPGLYAPWITKGYELLFREAGHCAIVHRRPGMLFSEIRALPPSLVEPIWAGSVASSLSALFTLVEVQGEVKVREISGPSRRIAFEARWKAR